MTKQKVAIIAQQSSYYVGVMVVVDAQPSRIARSLSSGLLLLFANTASPFLRREQSVISV
jgi:hypothetical protein